MPKHFLIYGALMVPTLVLLRDTPCLLLGIYAVAINQACLAYKYIYAAPFTTQS